MSDVELQLESRTDGDREVLRYEVSGGPRVLVAREGASGTEIVDVPAEGRAGLAWRVDSGIGDVGEYLAFLEDYVRTAQRLDACPMSTTGIGHLLEASESSALDAVVAAAAGH